MKKILILVGLVVSTSVLAAPSFVSKMLHLQPKPTLQVKKIKAHASNDVNFSGRWVGSCDLMPDEEFEMDISHKNNSIIIDDYKLPIEAIQTETLNDENPEEDFSRSEYYHWSHNGQQLIGTQWGYNNFDKTPVTSQSKVLLFLANNELHFDIKMFNFSDGELLGDAVQASCTFKKVGESTDH